MAQTVIGMFDNATEAQQAVQQLLNRGFIQSNIDISNQSAGTTTDTSSTYTDRDDDNDGIGGFFKSLFSDNDDDYNRYSHVARRSGAIVTVHAQSREEAERACDILDDNGAVNVDERASAYGYSGMTNTGTMGTATTGVTDTDTTSASIPIIEENMSVGKREVETGGARLRSFIVERPVEETLRLRQEHVFVNRTPVNRPATEADFTSFREGEMEVTEHGEVPVVGKEARVVEEVSLGKEVEEREETIRGTVRNTEVEVENLKKNPDDPRLNS
jgi:stress response protein YsnF